MTLKTMKADEMPAPETLVDYGHGMCGAAMFHYGAEGDSVVAIAGDNGFDVRLLRMHDELGEEHTLVQVYDEGDPEVIGRWQPIVPEGWQLGGKWDTDDGPVAVFIKRHERT